MDGSIRRPVAIHSSAFQEVKGLKLAQSLPALNAEKDDNRIDPNL